MIMSSIKKRLGLLLFTASYLLAVYWVFTRSNPPATDGVVTIRIAHWQIELGPPDGPPVRNAGRDQDVGRFA